MFLNLMETFHPGGFPTSLDFLCLQWEKSSCLEFKVDFSGHMTIVSLDFLCLQWEKSSCLEFNVDFSGHMTIMNFSLVHSLQISVTGLNFLMFFSKIFHSTTGSLPSSFSFQK